MIQILLLFIVLALVSLILHHWLKALSEGARSASWRPLLWLVLSLFIVLALTGRLGVMVPLIGAIVAAFIRLLPVLIQFFPLLHRLWRQRAMRQQPSSTGSGHRSTAESQYLRMHLDHRTGDISGTVLAGRFAGRELHGMSLGELGELLRDCRENDWDSVALLEAYLDRVHGAAWRVAAGAHDTPRSSTKGMTADEAREILGLSPGASKEAIVQAHRRLMQKLHPDRGGSDYLAAQINRAKEVLLGS